MLSMAVAGALVVGLALQPVVRPKAITPSAMMIKILFIQFLHFLRPHATRATRASIHRYDRRPGSRNIHRPFAGPCDTDPPPRRRRISVLPAPAVAPPFGRATG